MAHNKQARKRIRTDAKRALRNKAKRSAMKTHIKRVLSAIESGDGEKARAELVLAQRKIDKAAKARVIHPNNAARKVSLLSRRIAAMGG